MTATLKAIRPDATSSKLLDAALEYHDFGWNIIPVIGKIFNTGIPGENSWKKYQEQRPTKDDLKRWLANPSITGIAVIHGHVSGGLACRDFDTEEAYQNWSQFKPGLASSLPTVKTRKGYHVYFYWSGSDYKKFDDGELIANNLHYSLLPPSKHPEGPDYLWLAGTPINETPTLYHLAPMGLMGIQTNGTPNRKAPEKIVQFGQNFECNKQAEYITNQVTEVTNESCGDGDTPRTIGSLPSNPSMHTAYGTLQNLNESKISDIQQKNKGEFDRDTIPKSVIEAIEKHQPTKGGQRNRKIFDFAQKLKGIDPTFSNQDLELFFNEWFNLAVDKIRTKDKEVSRNDFFISWSKVKHPSLAGDWAKILGTINKVFVKEHYIIDEGLEECPLNRLIRLCAAIQRHHGPGVSWPLSNRFASEFLKVSHQHAGRLIHDLMEHKYLSQIDKGTKFKNGKAASYVFLKEFDYYEDDIPF